MEITREELKALPYDVYSPTILEDYPKLKGVPEFGEADKFKDFNALLAYIILLYTPNTPLMRITDYVERRNEAIRLSGSSIPDIEASSTVTVGYLRYCRQDKWTSLCVYRESKYNLLTRLHADEIKSGEKTITILASIDDLDKRIEALSADIANGDKEIKVRIGEYIEEERVSDLRPENRVARVLQGKEAMDYNPYKKKEKGRGK